MPVYRPSPNELDRLLREETEKRKRMRLMQVREQSKINAARLRNAYKSEMKRQVNVLVKRYNVEALDDKENEIKALVDEYEESLRHVGDGHQTAKDWRDPHWDRLLAEEENAVLSQERYRLALDELRESEAADRMEAAEVRHRKQYVIDMERARAKYMASLPMPEPPPYEEALGKKKGRAVAVCDRKAMMATHYHIVPFNYAVEAVDPNSDAALGPDARLKAVAEEEKMATLRQRTITGLEENVIKAEMRGKDAIRREVVRQDYDTMLRDLEGLSRGDLARRQRDFQRLPQRLFAVPHRVDFEARLDERNRERGFENVFAGLINNSHFDRKEDKDDDEDDSGMPRPSLRPTSPTRLRRSRRQHGKDGDDGGRRHTSGGRTATESATYDVSQPMLDHLVGDENHEIRKNVRESKPRGSQAKRRDTSPPVANKAKSDEGKDPSKEQKLQHLYNKIRSQRDRWLSHEEPVRDRPPPSPRSPAQAPPNQTRVSQLSHSETIVPPALSDSESEQSMIASQRDDDEDRREPGRRPPMTDLEEVRRIRSLTSSQLREASVRMDSFVEAVTEPPTVLEGSMNSVPERDRLDEEMKELDRRMEELKKRGRQMTSALQCKVDDKPKSTSLKSPSYQRSNVHKNDSHIQRSPPQYLPSKKSNSDSLSVGSMLSVDSFGDHRRGYSPPERDVPENDNEKIDALRNYQRRALQRLESMSIQDSASSVKDGSEASYDNSIARQAAIDLERQVERLREQLDRENRREELIRHYINVKAARGEIGKLNAVTDVSNSNHQFDLQNTDYRREEKQSVEEPSSFSLVSPVTQKSSSISVKAGEELTNPFDDYLKPPDVTGDISTTHYDRASFESDGLAHRLDRSSTGVRSLPADADPTPTHDDLSMQQILHSVLADINTESPSCNKPATRPLAFLSTLTSDETEESRVVLEPGDLTFDTIRTTDTSRAESLSADKSADAKSESSFTPVASPETAVFLDRYEDVDDVVDSFIGGLCPLPMRCRDRPPPVQHQYNVPSLANRELSRISEVETPSTSVVDSKVRLNESSDARQGLAFDDHDNDSMMSEEDRRAAILRKLLFNNANKLQELREERKEDPSASLRSSLTQHTAALSDLNSTGPVEDDEEFCDLPALERFEKVDERDDKQLTLECLEVPSGVLTRLTETEYTQVADSENQDDELVLTQFTDSEMVTSLMSALSEHHTIEKNAESESNFVASYVSSVSDKLNESQCNTNDFVQLEECVDETVLSQYPASEPSTHELEASVGKQLIEDEALVQHSTTDSTGVDVIQPIPIKEGLSDHESSKKPLDVFSPGSFENMEKFSELLATAKMQNMSLDTSSTATTQRPAESVFSVHGDPLQQPMDDLDALSDVLSHQQPIEKMNASADSSWSTELTKDFPSEPLMENGDLVSEGAISAGQMAIGKADDSSDFTALTQRQNGDLDGSSERISRSEHHSGLKSEDIQLHDHQPDTDGFDNRNSDDDIPSQYSTTVTNSDGYPKTVSLTQLPLSDIGSSKNGEITQHTATTLNSFHLRPLSQNVTSCFSSDSHTRSDVASIVSSHHTGMTKGTSQEIANKNEDQTQASCSSRASDNASEIVQRLNDNTNNKIEANVSLAQYPVSISSRGSQQQLTQYVDAMECENKHAESHDVEHDTLQALDSSMPSYEAEVSQNTDSSLKTVTGDQPPDGMKTSDQQTTCTSTSERSSLNSIDRLIAESRKIRQLNEHSLRSFEMTSTAGILGEPDLSLVSGGYTAGDDLSQCEARLVNTSDHSSLSSFQQHEQSCESRLSSDTSGGVSLQEAYEAHRKRVKNQRLSSGAVERLKTKEQEPPAKVTNGHIATLKPSNELSETSETKKPKAEPVRPNPVIERRLRAARESAASKQPPPEYSIQSNIDDMKTTLESWKKARLTRNQGTSKSSSHSSSASISSGRSSDDVRAPPSRPEVNDDPISRTRRLWSRLEEVQAKNKKEEFEKEKEKYRSKGREYSDKLRAQLRSKSSVKTTNGSISSSSSRGVKSSNGSAR